MKPKWNTLYCTNCWRPEKEFTGGGSWSPDMCPCGCQDTKVWKDMSFIERYLAKRRTAKKGDKKKK